MRDTYLTRGDLYGKLLPSGGVIWKNNTQDATPMTPVEANMWKLALTAAGYGGEADTPQQRINVLKIERNLLDFLLSQDVEHPEITFEDFINSRSITGGDRSGVQSAFVYLDEFKISAVTGENKDSIFRLEIYGNSGSPPFVTEAQNLRVLELKLYNFVAHCAISKDLAKLGVVPGAQVESRKVA